jgi:hypothetical protein
LRLAPGASATITLAAGALSTATVGSYPVGGVSARTPLARADANLTGLAYQVNGSADSVAPGAPTNVSATALGSTAVRVSWSPSSDNLGVVGYRVTRAGGATFTTDTNFLVGGGVNSLSTYSYSVQAFDRQGNVSPATSVSVTEPGRTDFTAPTAPVVTATAGDHYLNVSWTEYE